MRKTEKIQVKKKQFRLYDIYRYLATGEQSKIQGIWMYDCNKDASVIVIRYGESWEDNIPVNYFSRNEKDLKEVIRIINRRLNNCHTPGPKRSRTKRMEVYDGKL